MGDGSLAAITRVREKTVDIRCDAKGNPSNLSFTYSLIGVPSLSLISTMAPHPDLFRFFALNSEWAKRVQSQEPDFFAQSATGQSPQVCVPG